MIIDVSKHNGSINWNEVKNHIVGAIIRLGYGDNIGSQDDERFHRNVQDCIKYNIPFGAYIYSYARTMQQAKSEAEHCKRLLEPYKNKLRYPVYLDLEEAGTESNAVQRACYWGDIMESAGYFCGIYANEYWWNNVLNDSTLDRFTKWVAKYSNKEPTLYFGNGKYAMWQYTSEGGISGISGNVDFNKCYRNFPEIINSDFWVGEEVTVIPDESNRVRDKNGIYNTLYYNKYQIMSISGDDVLIGVDGVATCWVNKAKVRR